MRTATIVLPNGYATAEEFARDCGFDLASRAPASLLDTLMEVYADAINNGDGYLGKAQLEYTLMKHDLCLIDARDVIPTPAQRPLECPSTLEARCRDFKDNHDMGYSADDLIAFVLARREDTIRECEEVARGAIWKEIYNGGPFHNWSRDSQYGRGRHAAADAIAALAAQPPAAPVETRLDNVLSDLRSYISALQPGDDLRACLEGTLRNAERIATSSDGCGEVGQSPALASEGHQRPLEHGVMPVGPITVTKSGPGASPSDPQCSAGTATAWIVERPGDSTFPRVFLSKDKAEMLVDFVNVNPPASMSPLFRGEPQGVPVKASDFWEALKQQCAATPDKSKVKALIQVRCEDVVAAWNTLALTRPESK